MSWLDGRLQGFDLETTGVDVRRDRPVSWALPLYDDKTYQRPVTADYGLSNPCMPIPDEAAAIHGITTFRVLGAPPWDMVVEHCASTILATWRRHEPIVGMNVKFDLSIIDHQTGGSLSQHGEPYYIADILVLDRFFDKWRKGPRKLLNLATHYGVDLGEKAHTANGDAQASVDILFKMAQRYPIIGQTGLTQLTLRQSIAHKSWALGYDAWRSYQNPPLPPLTADSFDWPFA